MHDVTFTTNNTQVLDNVYKDSFVKTGVALKAFGNDILRLSAFLKLGAPRLCSFFQSFYLNHSSSKQ